MESGSENSMIYLVIEDVFDCPLIFHTFPFTIKVVSIPAFIIESVHASAKIALLLITGTESKTVLPIKRLVLSLITIFPDIFEL